MMGVSGGVGGGTEGAWPFVAGEIQDSFVARDHITSHVLQWLNRSRETVVLDLFIALKAHGNACDVWAELHLGSRKLSTTFSISCSSAHDSRASYAPPISLRCVSTLLYHVQHTETRRGCRPLTSDDP